MRKDLPMTRKPPPQPKHPVFAVNLKRLRQLRGITWEDMSRSLNVSYNTVIAWSKGRSEPGLKNAVRLARLLDCHPDEFLAIPRPTAAGPHKRTD